jgi:hypothetical protein
MKFIKICILKNELRGVYRDINKYEISLSERNIKYHDGKLNIEKLKDDYFMEKVEHIWKLRRIICKLKTGELQ